jgi:N-acetylmuramoyl-L-alanine amidase
MPPFYTPPRPAVVRALWRRGLALFTLASGLGLVGCPASAEPLRSRPRSETPLPGRITLGGVSYTDVRAVFARLGYKSEWNTKTLELTLTSPSGVVVFTADSREATVRGMRLFLGESAMLNQGVLHVATIDLERFLLPMLRPEHIAPVPLRVIAIDAGHGGNDCGARSADEKLEEKTCTLDVARRLQRLLAGGDWRVIMTRTDDRYIALPERADIANAAKADLFISIHFNSVANSAAVRGTETYVLTPRFQHSTSSAKAAPEDKAEFPGNRHDAWSAVLGYHMHRQLLAKLKTEDRGLKRARYAVLKFADCPGVLVEAGYLSNAGEARKIADATYRGDIAEALASAVNAYANTLAVAAHGAAK